MALAIITGTNGGLGFSLKTELMALGWEVGEISRPKFDLANLDREDLSVFMKSQQPHERTILIHNACDMQIAAAADAGEHAARSLQINVVSAIEITSAFLQTFPNGEVALISSGAAKRGIAGWSLYCASKAAMEGYLRALDAEGIKTHTIDPGVIDTDMQKTIRGSDFPLVEQFRDMHRSGALKSAQDTAKQVVEYLD